MRTIFVSSTFKDMQAERDAIHDHVAPRINEKAVLHGDRIDFCDLRWGVNTENLDTDEGAKKVLDVCFHEIDRSEPPMIVILGYRYGWIPDRSIVSDIARSMELQIEDLEKSITALEIEYGAILRKRSTLVYFRDIVSKNLPSVYRPESREHFQKLQALKERLRQITGSTIRSYCLHLNNGQAVQKDIDAFADMLVNDLEALLTPGWEKYDQRTPFEREIARQWEYAESKAGMFLARQTDFRQCLNDVLNGKDQVIVCRGDPGSGKSTLLCRLACELRSEEIAVLPLIGGLTDLSNDAVDILEMAVRFAESLAGSPHYVQEEHQANDPRTKISVLQKRFLELSDQLKTSGRKAVLLIDALDQLYPDENRDNLCFIPDHLPENIRFFVTCTPDLKIRYKTTHVLLPLTEKDKRSVVEGICHYVGKEISQSVVEEILRSHGTDHPLYISLIVTRLLMMNEEDFRAVNSSGGSADASIAKRQIEILNSCSSGIEELSAEVFNEAGRRINPSLSTVVSNSIAVSRYGLRTADLAHLCEDSWSQLDFSRFVNYLHEYFQVRSDGRYDFFHKCIRAGLKKQMGSADSLRAAHRAVSGHLKHLEEDDPVRKKEWVYHMIGADQKEEFVRFMDRYALETDPKALPSAREYIANAAQVCREVSLEDGGKWVIDTLEYADSINRYTGVLWFVCKDLPDAFNRTRTDVNTVVSILKKAESVHNRREASMSDKNKRLFREKLHPTLAFLSLDAGNAEDSRRYAELHLQEEKKQAYAGGELTARSRAALFQEYYNAITLMKGDHNPKSLLHTAAIAREGLELMDEDSWNELLSGNYGYTGTQFFGSMAEVYGRLGEREKCLAVYQEDLRLRKKYCEQHPSQVNRFSLSGSYYNLAMTAAQSGLDESHIRQASGYIREGMEILDSLIQNEDAVRYFEEHKREFGGDSGMWQALAFCGAEYELAGLLGCLTGDPESVREGVGRYHQALTVLLYTYIRTGLPSDKRSYTLTLANYRGLVRFSSRAEYDEYGGDHIRWLEQLKQRVYEEDSEENRHDLYEMADALVSSIRNSRFPGHADIAMDILLKYGNKKLSANDAATISEMAEIERLKFSESTGDKPGSEERVSIQGEENRGEKGIPVNGALLRQMKDRVHYDRLLFRETWKNHVQDAIKAYAHGIDESTVLAIDVIAKKRFFKECEGILFTTEAVCSSSFPEQHRIIPYADIKSAAQFGDDAEVRLKTGEAFSAYFGDSTSFAIKILNLLAEHYR